MVAVAVAAVEGDDDVGARDGRGRRGRRRRPRRRGAGQRVRGRQRRSRPESANAEQLDLGDAEAAAAARSSRLAELADAAGRDRHAGLDLARLAAGRADDDGAGAARRRVHEQRAAAERLVVGVRDHDEQAGRAASRDPTRTKDSIAVDHLLGHLEHREVAVGVEPPDGEPRVGRGVLLLRGQHLVGGRLGVEVQRRAGLQSLEGLPAAPAGRRTGPRSRGRRGSSGAVRSSSSTRRTRVQRGDVEAVEPHRREPVADVGPRGDCRPPRASAKPGGVPSTIQSISTTPGTRSAPRRRRSSRAAQPAWERPTGTTVSMPSASMVATRASTTSLVVSSSRAGESPWSGRSTETARRCAAAPGSSGSNTSRSPHQPGTKSTRGPAGAAVGHGERGGAGGGRGHRSLLTRILPCAVCVTRVDTAQGTMSRCAGDESPRPRRRTPCSACSGCGLDDVRAGQAGAAQPPLVLAAGRAQAVRRAQAAGRRRPGDRDVRLDGQASADRLRHHRRRSQPSWPAGSTSRRPGAPTSSRRWSRSSSPTPARSTSCGPRSTGSWPSPPSGSPTSRTTSTSGWPPRRSRPACTSTSWSSACRSSRS